jgi:hypothetical protein
MKTKKIQRFISRISSITSITEWPLTVMILMALGERWHGLKGWHNHVLRAKLEEILGRVDRLPVLDSRSADEILGYDEHGVPR